jgi:hypothetical protein
MALELKDWLNSINFTKEDLSEHIKSYPSFVINKILAGDIGCVMLVNELNKRYTMSPEMQYKFLLYSVPKKKRYNPYHKKTKDENLDIVREYFKVSTEKAREYLDALTAEQLQNIKRDLFKGGVSK